MAGRHQGGGGGLLAVAVDTWWWSGGEAGAAASRAWNRHVRNCLDDGDGDEDAGRGGVDSTRNRICKGSNKRQVNWEGADAEAAQLARLLELDPDLKARFRALFDRLALRPVAAAVQIMAGLREQVAEADSRLFALAAVPFGVCFLGKVEEVARM